MSLTPWNTPAFFFFFLYQGELLLISSDYKIYQMPCGDLCYQRSASMTAGFYLGCYADTEDERVLEYLSDSDEMTAEVR